MDVATLAASLIRVFEGVRLAAYWDPTGKVWSIAFGRTSGVKQGDTCTFEQAIAWLAEDSAPLIALVADRPVLEAAALTSFAYNCGEGALKRVLAGSITVDHEEFWAGESSYGEVSGGVRLPGLFARRQLEAALIEVSRGTS
jgi:lysozyme